MFNKLGGADIIFQELNEKKYNIFFIQLNGCRE
jgi:hypothetical protein